MSRVKKNAAIGALVVSFIGFGSEGLRQVAYPDPATRGKPWTICFGHTGPEVTPGLRKSLAECKALLIADSDKKGDRLERCMPGLKDAPIGRYVAFLSLAINIGEGGVCRSSVARDFNAGRVRQACDDLLKFNRAAGIVFPGLTARRKRERVLCLQGL